MSAVIASAKRRASAGRGWKSTSVTGRPDTVRTVILKIHLYLGVAAAIFLVVLGVTGCITAFENDIDHWLHPALWYVTPGPRILPEEELIHNVEARFGPARVAAVQMFRQPNLVQLMQMTDRSAVFVSPYDGAILGRTTGASTTQRMIGYIHQIHTHLVPDPRQAPSAAKIGAVIVQIAGLILCLLAPTGLILWWRTKRLSIKWKASWFRVCFDAHHAIGICAAVFLFTAALTGVLIGSEEIIYAVTRSAGPGRIPPLQSAPIAAAASISVDRAMEIARGALPGATVSFMQLPLNPKATFIIVMRVPEDTSETAHSYVFIDQYSGQVLYLRNFLTDSFGYRAVRFNRSIHTGDIWGLPSHMVVSFFSLMLAVMVVTGLVIWFKKLAV